MVSTRYHVLSVVSGCVWGALGYYLSYRVWPNLIWAPVAASPLIGLGMGLLFQRCCSSSLRSRIFLSLVTLMLAVTLFGFAAGIYDAIRGLGHPRILSAVVIQAVMAAWWGVTFTGYFLILWPLSFFNHTLICKFGGVSLPRRDSP